MFDVTEGLGLPVEEGLLTRYDLYTAEECIMTGTGAEIISVVRVDGRQIGTGCPGPVAARIRQAFGKLCREEGVAVFVDGGAP